MNFIFLGLFTLAQGFMLGCTTIVYRGDEVMLAVAITAVVCFSLTIFAFQTKWDFTVMGGVLFVAVIILMLFGLVAIFFPGKTMSMVYGCFGAILFSIYLIYGEFFSQKFEIPIKNHEKHFFRHTTDDGWQTQVLHQSRRVHFRVVEPLFGHCQHFLVHFDNYRCITWLNTSKNFLNNNFSFKINSISHQ